MFNLDTPGAIQPEATCTNSVTLILLSIITIVCYTVHFESTLKEGHSGQNVEYAITFETYFKDICGNNSCACELCQVGEDQNNLAH